MHDNINHFTDTMIKQTIEKNKIMGIDQYNKEELEYAECYAKFLIALYYKDKSKKEKSYRETAKKYINYMLNLANENEEFIYWGLPFNWGGTKNNEGFLITTSFCLKALYLWYKEGVFKDKNIIRKSINWCMALHDADDHGFYYSPKLKQNIYNATAVACGVLSMTEEFLTLNERNKIEKVISSLIGLQKNGYWNYSSVKEDVDLLHQCYTCEGMFDNFYVNKNLEVLNSAIEGVKFLNANKNFTFIERYLFKLSDSESLQVRLKHRLLKIYSLFMDDNKRFRKTRAWSYASFIRTLIYSYYFTNDQNYKVVLEETLSYVFNNIIIDENIVFQAGEECVYIRNSYHVLEALCFYEYFIETGEIR
jgi:hypothetical protein